MRLPKPVPKRAAKKAKRVDSAKVKGCCGKEMSRPRANWRGLPLPKGLSGQSFAEAFLSSMLQGLGHSRINDVVCSGAMVGSVGLDGCVRITVGTVCSGSEIMLTILPQLSCALAAASGTRVEFQHQWSCEANVEKAAWIVANFPETPHIFLDISLLCDEEGCPDYITGTRCRPEPVDLLVGGTSCKDASRMSMNQLTHRDAIATEQGSTGATFGAFRRLTKHLRPKARA